METPVKISIGTDLLCGVLHGVDSPYETGVLILTGGPQTRVGSHRQFVLLARLLADKGIPVLRFDYRGMGDSSGEMRGFEEVDEDIEAAIDQFFVEMPKMKSIVLLGLCDAASSALIYAQRAKRVEGLVLLNPWVRTVAGEAKTRLKYYYFQRLLNVGFWRKVIKGQFEAGMSISSFFGLLKIIFRSKSGLKAYTEAELFPDKMLAGFESFSHPVLIVISGNDLTGREFQDSIKSDRRWKTLLKRKNVVQKNLVDADHTFSRREWRDQVSMWVSDWILGLK